ncbi:MAG: TIGR01777 family oxidoreductase [Gemmatimonadales bacterium]
MKIVIGGASGFIGSVLAPRLRAAGHDVVPLVRRPLRAGERAIAWDPGRGQLDPRDLRGSDVVVNLAGENVFGRWTAAKKRRIRASRVDSTRLVSDGIAQLAPRPQLFLAASAVGYYGNRGAETLTEASAPGDDFLAAVARDWEAATAPAARAGIRVVNMRFGVVLGGGGALARLLPPFRLGVGGPIGSGAQYFSWIAMDDLLAAVLHLLDTSALRGPVNLTAPRPVTNREFVRALGRVLGRPAVVPVPAFALRLAFGAEGAEMLRSGQRVLPANLLASGFAFHYPDIEDALRHVLGRSAA